MLTEQEVMRKRELCGEETEKYDAVLLRMDRYGTVSCGDYRKMLSCFSEEQGVYPVDVSDEYGLPHGIGFVTEDLIEKLDYCLSPLKDFVEDILGDTDKETDGTYETMLQSAYARSVKIPVRILMRYGY